VLGASAQFKFLANVMEGLFKAQGHEPAVKSSGHIHTFELRQSWLVGFTFVSLKH
jgi:hypothetical protein